jgi:hypothetical protein
MVAIPATSMLEIRLDAMHHFWRQSSGSIDLDHAAAFSGAGSGDHSDFGCGVPY